ncbi:MAG: hypothetical protein WAS56_12030 [Saprospiraceae bacterium]|jgi:hypothetical protein|nr:hypothetical protein [Saprospiraceae bacterium]MBK7466524.1 hypothetical protein [Saprospiraceae bacterium]MBK9995305.1 hypothetical protein [Saprospiraceae bacterium]
MKDIKAYQANFIYFVSLVFVSLWSYNATGLQHALIPAGIGILLSLFHKTLKQGEKLSFYIVAIITLLSCISFVLPLERVIRLGDTVGIIRMSILILLGVMASIVYALHLSSFTQRSNKSQ